MANFTSVFHVALYFHFHVVRIKDDWSSAATRRNQDISANYPKQSSLRFGCLVLCKSKASIKYHCLICSQSEPQRGTADATYTHKISIEYAGYINSQVNARLGNCVATNPMLCSWVKTRTIHLHSWSITRWNNSIPIASLNMHVLHCATCTCIIYAASFMTMKINEGDLWLWIYHFVKHERFIV